MFLCFIYLNSFEHPYKNHVEWDRLKHLLLLSSLAIFTMGGIYFIPLISDLAKNLALVHEMGIEVPMFPVGTDYERKHVFHFIPLEILTPSMRSVCPVPQEEITEGKPPSCSSLKSS